MAFLKVMSGPNKGDKYEIDRDEMILGRTADNAVPVNDPAISSKHCMIVRDGRKFTLKDLDSTNGTRLNAVGISEHRLSPKDIITVGSIEIMFDGSDVEPYRPAPGATHAPQVTVRINAPVQQKVVGAGSPFGAKRDTKVIWVAVITIFVLAALAALGFYLYKLFAATPRVPPPAITAPATTPEPPAAKPAAPAAAPATTAPSAPAPKQ